MSLPFVIGLILGFLAPLIVATRLLRGQSFVFRRKWHPILMNATRAAATILFIGDSITADVDPTDALMPGPVPETFHAVARSELHRYGG